MNLRHVDPTNTVEPDRSTHDAGTALSGSLLVVGAVCFVVVSRSELFGLTTEALALPGFISADRWLLVTGVLFPIVAVVLAIASLTTKTSAITQVVLAMLLPAVMSGVGSTLAISSLVVANGVDELDGARIWFVLTVVGTALVLVAGVVWAVSTRLFRRPRATPSIWFGLAGVGLAIGLVGTMLEARFLASRDLGAISIVLVAVSTLPLVLFFVALLFGGRRGAHFVVAASLFAFIGSADRSVIFDGGIGTGIAVQAFVTATIAVGAFMVARTAPQPAGR